MADFSATSIALAGTFPTNEMITDDKGMPGIYVKRAKKVLGDLLNTTDSTVHPAFIIDNTTYDVLHFGKFEGMAHNSRIYSLPAEEPKASINLDTYVQYCRNKGAGHHCITAAEWAFLALLCKKNGTQPLGNNNYGKDTSESTRIAIPTTNDGTNTCHVATGTGPKTWSDTHELDGIFDLNGNVWEWIAGIRLVYGELQVIPYNDAATIDVDMSASSTAWKAINASATSYSDLYVTPDGSGTTEGTVKLDYASSHWQWATAITSQQESSRNAAFASTTASGLSDFTKLYFQAMALLPEDEDTDYGSDQFYANNGEAERCAYRGGNWYNGAYAGVFDLSFSSPRSNSGTNVGGRPAFYE